MKVAALGDVAEFVNGFAFKPEDWHGTGLPIIRIQNLTDPSKAINYTTRTVPERFRVRRGDLLVSWSATLGVFTWDRTDEALVNQHIFRVIPSSKVDHSFLRHMLTGALSDMNKHLHGATMQHVNRGEFLATEIPLPELPEQRRVAAILDHAASLRAKRHQAQVLLDSLTRSVFRQMFGDLEAGVWNKVPFGDLVSEVGNGTSPNCESRPAKTDEWGVLKLGAVTYGEFRPLENKAFLGEVGGMEKNEVRAGDILMTRKNTPDLVGAVALVDQVRPRLLLPDLIFRLHVDAERIDRHYFQALMMSPQKRPEVRNLSSGSASSMPNISKARLATLPVELPPLELQREFSARVRLLNRRRLSVKYAASVGDKLFASLQARAFRGEV